MDKEHNKLNKVITKTNMRTRLIKYIDNSQFAEPSDDDWPAYISRGTSRIPGAGWGIYALQILPQGMKLGTYKGELIKEDKEDWDSDYIWEIDVSDKITWYIDAKNPRKSNWTRYVNCPRFLEEENVEAMQEHKKIVYYTTRTIYPGEELYVWYGPTYGQRLGIGKKLKKKK